MESSLFNVRVPLDGLNIMALAAFEGNLWADETTAIMGVFMDERAAARQREALQMIFGGRAGGFPAVFAELIGEMRGIEFVPIEFEVASDLSHWRAEVPGRRAPRQDNACKHSMHRVPKSAPAR